MTEDRGQKILARFCFFLFLSSVVCCPSFASAADENPLANFDSVEVPAKSEHVVLDAAFISPGGHLVLQANGLDDGLKVNFYDAQTGDWLLRAPLTSQEEVGAEQNKLVEGGFTKLEHMPMITLPNGAKVFNYIDVKSVCFRPYAYFIELAPPGGATVESAIYLKRKTPATVYSAADPAHGDQSLATTHSCQSFRGGNPALIARYAQEAPFFFSDGAGGFFALVSRYAIHFDASGHSAFFAGQNNPVFLNPGDTRALRAGLAAANKSADPQAAIIEAEGVIDRTAQTQMQEAAE